jgi:arabinogalactan oligomer/maltooligosaccharide transport system substrate-binding protein
MNGDRRSILRAFGGTATIGALAGCVSFSGNEDSGGSGSSGSDGSGDGGSDGDSSSGDSSDDGTATEVSGSATIWTNRQGEEVESIKSKVSTFEEQAPHDITHKNITKDLKKKTKTALAAGNGPASFGWAHDWAGEFHENGLLSDQSGEVDVEMSKFSKTAQEAAKYKDDLIGLPFSSETVGLVYNTDIVDSAPETLADMKSVMEEYHDPENGKYGLSYPLNGYFYSAWAHAYGGYYFDEESGELGLTDEKTLKGFRTVIEDLYPYMPDDPAYGAQTSPFKNGKAAFAINGPWFTGSLEVPYEVAQLPTVDGNQPSPYTGISLWYFTARAEGSTAAAARSWAEWYTTNEDLHRELANEFGFIPVLKSLEGSEELPDDVKGFAANVKAGRPIPTNPKMNQVWGPTETAFTNALNGKKELKKAMADAETKIKENW